MITDEQLVQAAATAVVKRGDGSWSLADVAREAGVSPAALVKRFGSRHGLLVAVARTWVGGLPSYDGAAIDDPVAHVRQWVADWAGSASAPSAATGHLTLLLDEIVHDETRELLVEGRQAQTRYLAAALEDAHQRALLRRSPPEAAVELWLDLLAGAAVGCAIDRSDRAVVRALTHIDSDIESWRNA